MKNKTMFIIAAAAILVLAVPIAAHAQTNASVSELEYIDAQVEIFLPHLQTFESDYYAVNGRYYQALESHASAPNVPTVPDGINSSPTDQPETLAFLWDAASLPDVLAWSFRVDTYTAPDGSGYVVTIETQVDGVTYRRSINYGPTSENWRAAPWYSFDPSEI